MNQSATLALTHALTLCQTHAAALREAVQDWRANDGNRVSTLALTKEQLRILDQFAYRYIRLQDDMGMKLFPAVLRVLGEDVASMSMVDRLNRLEQLGWIYSAEAWMEHLRIRNEFAHDYPEAPAERHERIALALGSAEVLVALLERMSLRLASIGIEVA